MRSIRTPSTRARAGRPGDPITLPKLPPGNSQSADTSTDWPQGLALTQDGQKLVVALNQVDAVAIVDLGTSAIKTVKVGQFSGWVAIDPAGTYAYVTNEYDGTVSKIALDSATVTKTIGVGGPGPNPDGRTDPNVNAHPESLVIDPGGRTVYVPVANRDQIATIDTATDAVSHISLRRGDTLGAEPVAVALSPDGSRLYAADENEDDIAVVDLSSRRLIGRVPTAAFPTAVAVTPGKQLIWVGGKGFGSGPNPDYPTGKLGTYVLDMFYGRVGVLSEPSGNALAGYTATALRQMVPANAQIPPRDTPLRPNGPIKHVFYVIKENRTYDQIFGSLGPEYEGDPSLELFDDNGVKGPAGGITPNAHALVRKFGLMTHLYADSDVSQDGHQITDSAIGTDFVQRDMHANYSGRGREISNDDSPVAAPPRYYIFDQAVRQGLSFRNYGDDWAIGQLADVISHSRIWKSSAIFIIEDDSQDGADHIDSHRMPAYAISPYVKHRTVIGTRYDQASVMHSIELILGLKPLGLNDSVATPLYDAFTSHRDLSTYTAIKPEYPLDTPNPARAASAALSKALPWSTPDAVPQAISDRILWESVWGAKSRPPLPGPNASEDEEARADTAMSAYRAHQNVGRALARMGTYIDNQA